jgi:small subunit ribosomal protein S20
MANSLSSKKRARQNTRRRLANRVKASAMKTAIRRVDAVLPAGDAASIAAAVTLAYKRIDKAARKRIIHPNTAARRKALVARHASQRLQGTAKPA